MDHEVDHVLWVVERVESVVEIERDLGKAD
jgi:hypothetical protein